MKHSAIFLVVNHILLRANKRPRVVKNLKIANVPPRAGVYRGRRETAKFAVYREISRNLTFAAKYREICSLSRNIAKVSVYREISQKLHAAVFARVLEKCLKMSRFVSKCRTFQQLWLQVFQNVENVEVSLLVRSRG